MGGGEVWKAGSLLFERWVGIQRAPIEISKHLCSGPKNWTRNWRWKEW